MFFLLTTRCWNAYVNLGLYLVFNNTYCLQKRYLHVIYCLLTCLLVKYLWKCFPDCLCHYNQCKHNIFYVYHHCIILFTNIFISLFFLRAFFTDASGSAWLQISHDSSSLSSESQHLFWNSFCSRLRTYISRFSRFLGPLLFLFFTPLNQTC